MAAKTVSSANATGVVYVGDIHPRKGLFASWQRVRHGKAHWFVECFAEAMGVFFYVYCGVGSQAGWVLGNLAKETGVSSLLQVGFAYAMGILFAITICSGTSGGHFSPCVTIVRVLFNGFPPLKAVRYIVAQILGGYLACLFVYTQYSTLIKETEAALGPALEAVQFTPSGPAGIFAFYLAPGSSIGQVFLNEFICDFLIGLVIFGALDPSNVIVPPSFGPVLIAMIFGVLVWGFSPIGFAANTARDLGGRLAALTIWGKAATGHNKGYAALTALTNIPATILAAGVHEMMFVDSDRVVSEAHRELHDFVALHRRQGPAALAAEDDSSSSLNASAEKGGVGSVERV